MSLALLITIAGIFTVCFFLMREPIAGWVAVPSWFIVGTAALGESLTPWDMYYAVFFLCCIGITPGLALSLYTLNKQGKKSELSQFEDEDEDENEDEDEDENEEKKIVYKILTRQVKPPRDRIKTKPLSKRSKKEQRRKLTQKIFPIETRKIDD